MDSLKKIALAVFSVAGVLLSCDRSFPDYPFDEHNFVADKAVAYHEGLAKDNPVCMRFSLVMVQGKEDGGKMKSDGAIVRYLLNVPFSLSHKIAGGEYTGSDGKSVSGTYLLKDSYLVVLTPKMEAQVSYPIEGGTLKIVPVKESEYDISAGIVANGKEYSFKYSGVLDVVESNISF